MNRLLGASSSFCVDQQFQGLTDLADECGFMMSSRLSAAVSDNEAVNILISDGGSVAGSALGGHVELHYLGWINSLPGDDFDPLANPNRTAAHLLELFLEKDTEFLSGVEGSYVVSVTDRERDRLLLARDTSGGFRLYIGEFDGQLFFASHLSDFRYLLGARLELDRSVEAFLLAYEFLPDGKTCYRHIVSMAAGTVLEWRSGRRRLFSIRHPEPNEIRGEDTDPARAIDTLEGLMLSSIHQQIPATGKIAVLLGGFDSALIAAMLKKMGRDVETFTFRYEEEQYNQAHVEELAEYLGITHHWVPITDRSVLWGAERFAQLFNQPVSQMHYPVNSLVACLAMRSKGFSYCLTGDGCDGLFLGYPTVHQRARLIQSLSSVTWLLMPVRWIFRVSWLERYIGHPYRLARNVTRILRRQIPARAYISACSVDEFSLGQLVEGEIPVQVIDSEKTLARLAENGRGHSVVRMAYMGKSHVGLNQTKLEGCSSWSGVVLNSPYLHPALKRFAQLIPEDMSRPAHHNAGGAAGKYILTQMARQKGYLPDNIIDQPKRSPVMAPVDAWYKGSLRGGLMDQLKNLPFRTSKVYIASLFRDGWCERVFRKHVGISRYTSNVLSMLVTYASFSGCASSDDR